MSEQRLFTEGQSMDAVNAEAVGPHRFHPHEMFDALPGTEVRSMRSAFTKTYDLGSGRFQAVVIR